MYGGANAAAASTLGGGASVMGGSALPTGGGLLGAASQYGKPAMQALSSAQQSGLLGDQQQPAPQPQAVQQATGGAQTLAQIAQQGDQIQQQLQQTQMQRKQRRMGLLGREVA